VLSGELTQRLRELSRGEGVTLFMTLLAGFKTLLYKYTGQEDVIVGTAIANRNRAEIEPLIGFFVNMLPLRTDLRGNPRFKELLRRVKEVALGGYAHQDLPYEKMVEELRPERAGSQMPLFNVGFGVQNAPGAELKMKGLKIEMMAVEEQRARMDLTLWVTEGREGLEVDWTYSTDLFRKEMVIRMQSHFETLLSRIVERPDALLDELEMLSEEERAQQTLNRINREEYNYSRFKSVKPKAVAILED
jgi:non-ribosomal peptide synthetase component F